MSKDISSISYSVFKFDVPEPQEIDGSFEYNYFLKDERTSTNTASDYAAFVRHNGQRARRTHLTFSPLSNITELQSNLTVPQRSAKINNYKSNITSEVEMQRNNYAFVTLQDDSITSSIVEEIAQQAIFQKAKDRGLSSLEALFRYASIPGTPDASELLDLSSIEASNNLTYFDPATGEDLTTQKEAGVPEQSVGVFLNRKFSNDILNKSENTPFSPLWGKIDSLIEDSSKDQQSAMVTMDSSEFSLADHQFSGTPVPGVIVTSPIYEPPEIVGYLLEKYEIDSNGARNFVGSSSIVVSEQTDAYDNNIKYGVTYSYRIKTIFSVYMHVGAGGQEFLVSSRGTPYIDIPCIETVPPAPPQCLEFFTTPELYSMIFWEMPQNKQEDIKRFQIFRRESLSEPFVLLSEIDFDDSEELTERREIIPDFTNSKKESITTFYIDNDFDLDKTYIYAICSVDAHDLSSPYSSQFQVKYSRIYGRIEAKVIAFAGAPKQYPNFTLKGGGVVPCIKDSGHKKMKIYFDPDTLILKSYPERQSSGEVAYKKERYLETNAYGKPIFKIQIINLDWQQSEVVEINLMKEAGHTDMVFNSAMSEMEGT